MKTIMITITGGSSTSIVITEQKTEDKEAKRKEVLAYLDAMFKPVLKDVGSKCD